MAIAATVPVVWGVMTDRLEEASWITLAAECICWVELKGSFAQRFRVLVGGAFLALFFAALGAITAGSIWLSMAAMLLVGFLAGLFKNLGDRGAGLAVCVQVLFVLSNAFPIANFDVLEERLSLVALGGIWTIFTGVLASAFIPAQQPYRRTIALIWRANANLSRAIAKGWDGRSVRSTIRELYEKEKEVRVALDTSFNFFERMAHQQDKRQKDQYELAQLRKATALVASHIVAIGEEVEQVRIKEVHPELRIKLHDTLRALGQALDRMGVFVVSLKPEEELLINSRMLRLNKLIALLKEHKQFDEHLREDTLKRVVQLLERTVKLMQVSLDRIEEMGEDLPAFKSYSLFKTLLILHPRHWLRNIRLLFNLNTNNARYAIRSAIAATIGLFIYKWFDINYGYWIAFTSLIVIQPYFTATFKKAVDRVMGTLAGGVVGGLLIMLPTGIYAKELMLFLSFIFMVYFIRKRYSIAVFFITVSVVLLFDVEEIMNPSLIIIRALCTIGGAVLGITAGFALLPTWDRNLLPKHLADALACNYQYFIATFFPRREITWTRHKRSTESKNSNAFDSFSRYMQEPFIGNKKRIMAYYQLINHSVRITRELNNIHLEWESKSATEQIGDQAMQHVLILECLDWFNKNLNQMERLHVGIAKNRIEVPDEYHPAFTLNLQQVIYIEKLLIELKTLHQDLLHIDEKQ